MNSYSMTCECGEIMNLEAANRNEAVKNIQGMMTEETIKKHMAEKHPGKPVMSVAACHAMIAKNVMPAA